MYNSYSALNLLGGMLYTMILLVIAYFVLKIVANWKIEPSQNVQYQTPNAPAEVKTQPTQQNQNQDNG